MKNEKITKILLDKYKKANFEGERANLTKQECELILNSISEKCTDDLEDFIKGNLFIFRRQYSAFDWIYCDDDSSDVMEYLLEQTVKPSMVNKKVIDLFLEANDNYLKLNDDLYLTWY